MKNNAFLLLSLCFLFGSCQKPEEGRLAAAADYFDLLFKKGDLESLGKMIHPEAVYHQAKGLPYGGTYTGFDEWTQMFFKVSEYFKIEIIGTPVFYYSNLANAVVMNFTVKFEKRNGAGVLTMSVSEILEFDDEGAITGATPYYFDTRAVAEFVTASNIE